LICIHTKNGVPDSERITYIIRGQTVGNNEQRPLGRHNVSQSDTSKYRGVTRDVAIVAGKD